MIRTSTAVWRGDGLHGNGHAPQELHVTARVDWVTADPGFVIKTIELELEATVAGFDAAQFQIIADTAKKNCPLSKALAATPLTLSARLT
jgi:osmotically inducible protein OsmC